MDRLIRVYGYDGEYEDVEARVKIHTEAELKLLRALEDIGVLGFETMPYNDTYDTNAY